MTGLLAFIVADVHVGRDEGGVLDFDRQALVGGHQPVAAAFVAGEEAGEGADHGRRSMRPPS
jgi:hypothetical protein